MGPNLMNLNRLPLNHRIKQFLIFYFEFVVQIWTGSREFSDVAQINEIRSLINLNPTSNSSCHFSLWSCLILSSVCKILRCLSACNSRFTPTFPTHLNRRNLSEFFFYPINVQTAEPNGPTNCVRPQMSPRKVYECKISKNCLQNFRFSLNFDNPRKKLIILKKLYFCFIEEKMLKD